MTPDELRKLELKFTTPSNVETETSRLADTAIMQASLLAEIAAQLAELNQHLAVLTDPTKGITANLCSTNDVIRVRIVT